MSLQQSPLYQATAKNPKWMSPIDKRPIASLTFSGDSGQWRWQANLISKQSHGKVKRNSSRRLSASSTAKNCCLNQDLPTNRLLALLKTPGPDPAENIRRSLATSNLIGLKSRGFWGQSNKLIWWLTSPRWRRFLLIGPPEKNFGRPTSSGSCSPEKLFGAWLSIVQFRKWT